MNGNEIIIHKCSSRDEFQELADKAIRYALISLPFTVNRMKLDSIKSRILNIYKGKLAEELLCNYAISNQLSFDFRAGETGFWKRDLFDFSFGNYQWDLKNNFVHSKSLLHPSEYLKLPALIPNRHQEDQWTKALKAKDKGFVFSFMNLNEFPELNQLNLSVAQLQFLMDCIHENEPDDKPFEEEWFIGEIRKRGNFPFIDHSSIPDLIITGYALPEHYSQFLDTDGKEHFNYSMFGGRWYELDYKSRLNFCGGLVRTRIKNATCPILALPSFKSFIEASEK